MWWVRHRSNVWSTKENCQYEWIPDYFFILASDKFRIGQQMLKPRSNNFSMCALLMIGHWNAYVQVLISFLSSYLCKSCFATLAYGVLVIGTWWIQASIQSGCSTSVPKYITSNYKRPPIIISVIDVKIINGLSNKTIILIWNSLTRQTSMFMLRPQEQIFD